MGENGIHHMFWDQSFPLKRTKKSFTAEYSTTACYVFLKEGTRGTRSRLALRCATVKPVCESVN